MSFSMQVKEELQKEISTARHCRIAEIAAIILFCGRYNSSCIKVNTENLTVASKYYILLEKTFKISAEVSVRRSGSSTYYQVVICDRDNVCRVLQAIKVASDSGEVSEEKRINGLVIQNTCCKRAFLRGAFMAIGSITDPNKSYHLEMVCNDKDKSETITSILSAFNIESRHIIRKRHYVVYLKEGAQISDVLNVMSAHVALMELENVRIVKEMRNQINRKVNCETANISKTTDAANRQRQDIMYIRDNMGFGNLPEQLKEIAELRLENPDVALKELGTLLHPPLGKSGVNHRLRRLGEIADNLRRLEGGKK